MLVSNLTFGSIKSWVQFAITATQNLLQVATVFAEKNNSLKKIGAQMTTADLPTRNLSCNLGRNELPAD
jgi:hypothetical protein